MPSEMKLFVSYNVSDLGVFLVCSCDTALFGRGVLIFLQFIYLNSNFIFRFRKPVTQLFFINQKWHVICEMKSNLALV